MHPNDIRAAASTPAPVAVTEEVLRPYFVTLKLVQWVELVVVAKGEASARVIAQDTGQYVRPTTKPTVFIDSSRVAA